MGICGVCYDPFDKYRHRAMVRQWGVHIIPKRAIHGPLRGRREWRERKIMRTTKTQQFKSLGEKRTA
mgnify:CR=1 FL=1